MNLALEIANGLHDGQIVWICDYRFKDIADKPIRNISPRRVLVRSNAETTKRYYYSDSHFVEVNSADKPTSKTHAVYDNTGYRSYSGVPLNAFDNEQECLECYNEQCQNALMQLDEWKSRCDNRYVAMKTDIELRKLNV